MEVSLLPEGISGDSLSMTGETTQDEESNDKTLKMFPASIEPLFLERDALPRRREFAFTAAFAFILLTAGLILIIVGLDWLFKGHHGGELLLGIGLVLIFPGAYSTYHVTGILLGIPGFEYTAVSDWQVP